MTETGAGQWGSSLSLAGQLFGVDVRVYMVKVSFQQKPFRRSMMQTWGAEVLASPIERVRVLATLHAPQHVAVGGQLLSDGAPDAPSFHFLVLEGRPLEQCQALIAGFTDLLVECLGTDRTMVRGGIWKVAPDDWAIAGVPAAQTSPYDLLIRNADRKSVV